MDTSQPSIPILARILRILFDSTFSIRDNRITKPNNSIMQHTIQTINQIETISISHTQTNHFIMPDHPNNATQRAIRIR